MSKNIFNFRNWIEESFRYYATFNMIEDIFQNSSEEFIKKDVFENLKLSKFKEKENHYLMNIENYHFKRKKSYRDYESFNFLDIDTKMQIKDYNNFNFHKTTTYSESSPDSRIVSTKKYKKDKNIGRDETKNIKKEKIIERPKYDLKLTFDLEANDINLINEFVDPDPKYIQNSEYLQIDYFLNMEINQENYYKIFDPIVEEDRALIEHYCKNDSNEFVLDYQAKLNNNNPKKGDSKLKELNDVDYLVYVVDEKQFYKKMTGTEKTFNSNRLYDSPKIKVKVKKVPIKFYDNHI